MADIAPRTTVPLTVITLPEEIDMAKAGAVEEGLRRGARPGVQAVEQVRA